MKFIHGLVLVLLVFSTQTQARTVNFQFKFACLSVDGQPIPTGSPLAGACCSGDHLVANPPAECRVGFNSILGDAGGGASGSMSVAENTLNTAQNLDGTVTDYGDGEAETPSIATPLAGGETSGITNSTLGSTGGFIDPKTGKAANGMAAGGTGSAVAGGSGGSLGMGSLAENARKNAASEQTAAEKAARLAYVRGGGAPSGKSNDPFAGLFGSAGSNGGNGAKGPDELKYGEDGNASESALASLDEDGVGTADDPADYLKRIDPSANLFKIVSARYMKKKSLWKVKTE